MELEKAQGKIARMEQEATQSRITKHTVNQVIGNPSDVDYPFTPLSDDPECPPTIRPQIQRDNSWAAPDDSRSDTSDALSAGGFNRARAIWANSSRPTFNLPVPGQTMAQPSDALSSAQWASRSFGQPFVEAPMHGLPPMQPMAPMTYTGPQAGGYRPDRMIHDSELMMAPPNRRTGFGGGNRFNRSSASSFPYASSNGSYDNYTPSSSPFGSVSGIPGAMNMNNMAMNSGMGMGASMYNGYQPQPIGTPLSPHAPEFTSSASTWKSDVSGITSSFAGVSVTNGQNVATEGQTFLPTTEPLNYRRLLDRTVNCNWKYIVDKIVCNNDQQASIFLQQKLKVGTTEQKYDIVEAIVAQAYALVSHLSSPTCFFV